MTVQIHQVSMSTSEAKLGRHSVLSTDRKRKGVRIRDRWAENSSLLPSAAAS